MPDSKILLVAQDIHDIREFDELLIRALISGGLLLLVVGLVEAVSLGYSAHRRLDTLSRSIKGIIEGDLTGRLPILGTNDDIDRLAEERGISLTLNPSQSPAIISGDAQLLLDALCNLLDNAIKFCPDHGRVSLSVITEQGAVGIRVTDTGPGIAQSEREAVFRRLYRAESSRHTPGNGLGMSMVAAVARLHDLKLTLSDAGPGCQIDLVSTRAH